MPTNSLSKQTRRGGFLALTPLLVFLASYLLVSLLTGDFYRMPLPVAFLAASVYAVAITRGIPFAARIEHFSAGAANSNVMLMIWIFVLAGAFAESARSMGAVDATVNLTLRLLPDGLLPAGLFLAACFVSLSIGTSVGTIVALAPVAGGLAGGVLGPFSPEDVYSGCKVRQHLVFYFLLPQTAATVGIFIQPGRFPDSLGPQLMFYPLHPLLAALL